MRRACGVGVLLMHFELRVQSLDVAIDQLNQELSAPGWLIGADQIGPPPLDCLAKADELRRVHVAREVVKGAVPDWIEGMAGDENLGDAPIFDGVERLPAQQPNGLEPIV